MIIPTRRLAAAPAAGVIVLLFLASGTALAQVPSAAPAPAPADFMTFEEVRYADKVESDGRVERVQHVKVLLRDAAAVAEFGQIGAMYVDRYVVPPDPHSPGLPTTYLNPGPEVVSKLRTVALSVRPSDELTEEVLLLIGPGGKVESVRNLSNRKASAFARVLPHLRAATVPFAWPEERPGKLVRRGLLTCHPLTSCSLVLDLGGSGPILRR